MTTYYAKPPGAEGVLFDADDDDHAVLVRIPGRDKWHLYRALQGGIDDHVFIAEVARLNSCNWVISRSDEYSRRDEPSEMTGASRTDHPIEMALPPTEFIVVSTGRSPVSLKSGNLADAIAELRAMPEHWRQVRGFSMICMVAAHIPLDDWRASYDDVEEAERAELARLIAKYGTPND